ncbi:hypothetical protein [Sporolactobacillus pectinivorans]|uniref:hypothetical protein n=1 Tax=Sporolactobacillus pectinivorans TaxID=1591408 RepID=UPI0018757A02|nr:hypothetical protein [Sporolactobacillus pectinivorans]
MGEAAEMILEGILCEQCGCLIDGEETGYPRLCEDCQKSSNQSHKRNRRGKKESQWLGK